MPKKPEVKLQLADYEGVAFDFDGTLANGHHLHDESRQIAFREQGLDQITLEQHQKGHLYGTRSNTIIAGVLQEAGVVATDIDPDTHPLVLSLVERKQEVYLKLAERGLDEHTNAVDALKLFNTYYQPNISIVTTARLNEITPFIRRYSLGAIFAGDHLVTHEVVRAQGLQPKPAPDAYLLAAKIMGIVDVSKMIVIEDSTGGVEASRRAGATTIAVGTTNARGLFYDEQLEYHPDYFFDNFVELIEAFKP